MPRYRITVYRPHWVASTYEIEAENEEKAREATGNGEGEWLGDEPREQIGFIDSYSPDEIEEV